MSANVGKIDRTLRLVIGLVLIAGPLLGIPDIWGAGNFKYIAMIVGVILAGTAMFRFCPLYRILGISTCRI